MRNKIDAHFFYKKFWLLFFSYLLFSFPALASKHSVISSNDSIQFFQASKKCNTKRLGIVIGGEVAIYGGLMVGLNSLWYKDFPRTKFHYFNDNKEWLQMDKVGHATTAYYVGKLGIQALDWSGVKHRNAIIYGGCLGSIFLTTVEIFDGYSAGWGFSKGDILANTAGSALLIAEELLWKEQRVSIKFSYTPSKYAQYRPNVLGKNFSESLLKDYNAQTYWLSANISSFLKSETKFPRWLNVAVGYGADGMTGGSDNPSADKDGNALPIFKRYRQYYFSLDVELAKIHTHSKFINSLFETIGFIKFPAPAVEYNNVKGVVFHPFFF